MAKPIPSSPLASHDWTRTLQSVSREIQRKRDQHPPVNSHAFTNRTWAAWILKNLLGGNAQ
ncbi:MAG: hypothetical protein R3E95_06790 [Thiolinea sp.]